MEELSNFRPAGKWVSMDNFASRSPRAGSSRFSGHPNNNENSEENAISVKELIRSWTEQSMDIIMEENPELEVCQGVLAKAKAIFEKK